MPIFNLRRKNPTLQERKELYKASYLKNLEQFERYISGPLLDINVYRKAVQEHFPHLTSILSENLDYRLLIQQCEEQYPEKMVALTGRLDTLREMAEKQPVTTEAALTNYKKTLDDELSDIKKQAELFIQQANKDITQLISTLASILFERSDPFFDITDRIRKRAYLDLFNIQADNAASPDYLLEIVSEFVDAEALSPAVRVQLAEMLEKLRSPASAKFVVFSLNEAFKATPKELTEIVSSDKDVAVRIQDLQIGLAENKLAKPSDYYFTTFQDYFSVFVRLDNDNKTIENDIKKQLDTFESQYNKCDQVKALVGKYREQLRNLIANFNNKALIEHHSQLNKQLVDLKNELQTGNLFQQVKRKKLAYLNNLQAKIIGILNENDEILSHMRVMLNNSPIGMDSLIKKHQVKRLEIETSLKKYITECEQLTSLAEIEDFANVSSLLGSSYEPIRIEVAEYNLAADILHANFQGISKFRVSHFTNQRERSALVSNLSAKVFDLLENLKDEQFGKCLEGLLQVVEAEPSSSDDLYLLKREFRRSVIEGKKLEDFMEQHVEKICDYLCQLSWGVWINNKEFYIRLNGYLNQMNIDRLQALSEERTDLRRTIDRVISTKKLLDLQSEQGNDAGSFWETCILFYEFNTSERPLPLFTTPQDREWFDSVKALVNVLMQQVNNTNDKKNNYTLTFFLRSDVKLKKQQALDTLKERLQALPNLSLKQALDETLKNWEAEFGAVIDKPRYRFYLVVLMTIYHVLKHITGQVVETESRHYVECLKESLYQASAAMQVNAEEEKTHPSLLCRQG